jgi:diguanylate cyclase (GGDEF)-like protein/PAS domain S-box-containing protein
MAIWFFAMIGLMRARAERDRIATSLLADATLDSIHEAVITIDADSNITRVNRAAEELTGFRVSEAIGQTLSAIFQLENDRRSQSDSVADEGPSLFTGKIAILRSKNGRRIPVETTNSFIRGNDGAVDGSVVVFRDVSDRQRYETEIKRLAYRDGLTELPNRTSFWERLHSEIALAARDRKMLGLLYLDLDGFKAINDTLGHRAGDDLLKGVAERLRGAIRRGDTVARLGGDEFCVILPAIKHAADAERIAEKLTEALKEPISVGHERVRARPSIGIAVYPQDAGDAEDLVHCADQAMYEAKHGGQHEHR